nr:ester cyclase [Paraburkholderia fynbosensis]
MGSLPAATGRTMRFTGTTMQRLKDGKTVEEIGLDDGLTALQQLGLVKAARSKSQGIQCPSRPGTPRPVLWTWRQPQTQRDADFPRHANATESVGACRLGVLQFATRECLRIGRHRSLS